MADTISADTQATIAQMEQIAADSRAMSLAKMKCDKKINEGKGLAELADKGTRAATMR